MWRRIVVYAGLLIAIVAALPYRDEHALGWWMLYCPTAYALVTVIFTTIRRWRLTHFVRMTGAIASVTVVVLWAVSIVAYVRVPYAQGRAVAIGAGNFIHQTGVTFSNTPLTLTASWLSTANLLGSWGSSSGSFGMGRVAFSDYIPIWPSAIALAIPTAVLCLLIPRHYPAGHCQNCGYNLTGNVSGVCPECGTKVEQA